jgi:hypothetical protein
MEWFGHQADDRSVKLKGHKQQIITPDGYVTPPSIWDGLACLDMHPPTKEEQETLIRVIFTADTPWDTSILDIEADLDNLDMFHEAMSEPEDLDFEFFDARIDPEGNFIDPIIDVNMKEVKVKEKDYGALCPCFGWLPMDVVKKTIEMTTQFAQNQYCLPIHKHFKSLFPALNVPHHNEPVVTDTFYADTPAIDDGARCAQIFVGRHTSVTDVYGMKMDAEFVRVLEDNICSRGAMDFLISDGAKAQVSKEAKDSL